MSRAMTKIVAAMALAAATGASSAAPRSPLSLDRIVMLMRHGVRPPTSAQPVPEAYAPDAWPKWGVDYGLLTEHGAQGIARLGEADRAYLVRHRLLPAKGCPVAGTISVTASNKPRAIRTAREWSKTLAPGCVVTVASPDGADDPIFHGLDGNPPSFDGHRAFTEAMAMAPAGGVEQVARDHSAEFVLLNKALGCVAPACDLRTLRSDLKALPHDRPDLTGALELASTASQSLLLEYLEGMPMTDVGWGRTSRAEIERMLVFHPIKFTFNNRAAYIAQAAAGPIARRMAATLNGSGAAGRVTLLSGHDTNIADVGGLLRLDWHVPSYPAGDVPPGSAIGLELWRDAKGGKFVRAFYRAQTMDQLRTLAPLTGAVGPYRGYLDIPGCGSAALPRSCTLGRFNALIAGKVENAAP